MQTPSILSVVEATNDLCLLVLVSGCSASCANGSGAPGSLRSLSISIILIRLRNNDMILVDLDPGIQPPLPERHFARSARDNF